jgi:aspartyl/asparaginyl-tRNA synthetase
MKALGIDEEELWWYLDTRRFGSAVHSGFGLGFERLVCNWNDEHTRRDSFSKNTIERRVLILLRSFH